MHFPIIIESEKFCKAISWFIEVDAITLCPFIICRNKDDEIMINHESIHVKQQLELGIIFFYLIYFVEWIYNLGIYFGDTESAYYNIIFEKEAYDNQDNPDYLRNRRIWSCFLPT